MADYKYRHWVVTLPGKKLYLGRDFYMGYPALYSEDEKSKASVFKTDELFDTKEWTGRSIIVNRGVECCDD